MSSETLTKSCKWCFSEIDARAVKCPECRTGQIILRFKDIAIPVVAVAAVVALVAGIISSGVLGNRSVRPNGPNHAANIEVVSSRLFFMPHEDSHKVLAVGLMKNVGETPIERTIVELRITDGDGSLIDAMTQLVHNDLPPGEEVSFKVYAHQNIHLPQSVYAQHRFIIRDAYQKP